jgi:hypothetical protein
VPSFLLRIKPPRRFGTARSDARAGTVEAKDKWAQSLAGQRLGHVGLGDGRGVEEQIATAAGARDLAAKGAGRSGRRVPPVNVARRDGAVDAALEPPALVQKGAEAVEITRLERRPHLDGQCLHPMKPIDGGGVASGTVGLVRQNRGGVPRQPGREEQQAALQPLESAGGTVKGSTVTPCSENAIALRPPNAAA